MPMRAYHASPYKFDLFDNSFIGKGEGAQKYGYGLYFTETLAVAEYYQRTVQKKSRTIYYDGKPISFAQLGKRLGYPPYNEKRPRAIEQLRWRLLGAIRHRADRDNISFDDAIDAETKLYSTRTPNDYLAVECRRIGEALKGRITLGGLTAFIYEVLIDCEPDQLLDWDKPLRGQSSYVQQRTGQLWRPKYTGSAMYEDVVARFTKDTYEEGDDLYEGEKKAAVYFVTKLQVPGMKYLDQLSREIGGSLNYVIFDPRIVKVVRRFRQRAQP